MIENTPTTEAAGAAVPNDTKFQCKVNENQPSIQINEGEISPVDAEMDAIREMAENPLEAPIDKSHIGLLRIKAANEWIMEAALRPDPKPLWMSLWFEGEACCLFADSNLGKSIYACNIANEIAKSQPVLYVDFELTDKQFQLRFTAQGNNTYTFPDNFNRAEISRDINYSDDSDWENEVIDSIEAAALALNVKVIIVDNLSWLCNDAEKGKTAGALMQRLNTMKKSHGWSILIIAHTPKRDMRSPITQNSLAGSKKLMNFFDSAFAIGQSAKDENLRYVKQVKVRFGAFEYNADNVIVCDLIQESDGYLHLRQIGLAKESEHLKEASDDDEDAIKERILDLNRQGKSYRDIASEVGYSASKVYRYIKSVKG